MNVIELSLPLTSDKIEQLKAGDKVLLSGEIYTARDAASKRIVEALSAGREVPFPIENSTLYFVGPCPPKPGEVVGSAGPTTSIRMDPYTPALLAAGVKGMIGKGHRSADVVDAIARHKAVYFAAIGGAGALIARRILSAEVVAYHDLGTEAVHRFEVDKLPVYVAVDSAGDDIFTKGRDQWRRTQG